MKIFDILDKFLEWGGARRKIIELILSATALLCSFFDYKLGVPFDLAWIAIVLCGTPIVVDALNGLITRFDVKADVLVAIALVAALIVREDFAAAEVAFIMQLGELLEELTVQRARAGIERLVKLTPTIARRLVGDFEEVISADQVKQGDVLKVLPGESVPADGVIISGKTSIDQSTLTGESLPVDKTVGDEVASGSINRFGSFQMRATKVGKDSSIQRMIKLVQSADAGKAKIVGLADRWATWTVVAAVTIALGTLLITHEIIRAVTVLVVFCPCALVLATPAAIMASIGNASKHGCLVKEGDALERLSKVKRVTFDKTGTLTSGKLKVVATVSLDQRYTAEKIYELTAAVEQDSEHPLGKAALESYRSSHERVLPNVLNFQMTVGRGVKGVVDGKQIVAGNEKMLAESGIVLNSDFQTTLNEQRNKGRASIIVAVDGVPVGVVALADILRPEVKDTIERYACLNIKPTLLTGDSESAAKTIADELGIQDVCAECLPEDKLKFIDRFQKKNEPVCMVGDGVNDAPALKKALVGIAMGGVGSDVAVEAADIALVNDEIKELPHLFALSKEMMRAIVFNLSLAMGINLVAVVLASFGYLGPVVGALVHNAGSFIVISNSALLLFYKKKEFDKKNVLRQNLV